MRRIWAGSLVVVLVVAAVSIAYGVETARSGQQGSTSTTSCAPPASSAHTSVAGSGSTGESQIRHVIIIVLENKDYCGVIGNENAPYENLLASRYALAGNYFAVSHPSLPNYFSLVAGSTLGVTSTCFPSQCSESAQTIASLLESHGLSWKEYAESMPTNCSRSDSPDGLYVVRHDPWVYFTGIAGSLTGSPSRVCDAHVVPFSQFWTDLQTSNLPSYSFITPNTCDDAHSCPLSSADAWLSTVVPRIINSGPFASTALFVVYDEGSGTSYNTPSQVPCILVSPFARPGFVSDVRYTHYSLLATVERIFGVGNLGENDANATIMSDMFALSIQNGSS